jgi:hypothetical protein
MEAVSFSHLRYWKFDADADGFLTPPVHRLLSVLVPSQVSIVSDYTSPPANPIRRQHAGTGGGNEYVVLSDRPLLLSC